MAETTIDPMPAEIREISPIRADLGMIVARSARRFGAKPALIAGGRTLTYRDLDELCGRMTAGLHAIGVRPGDRVSLYSPNRWEWVVAYHAAMTNACHRCRPIERPNLHCRHDTSHVPERRADQADTCALAAG